MDKQKLIKIIEQEYQKEIPPIKTGDFVKIHQKIKEGGKTKIQVFEGLVIRKHKKKDLNATFTVRKIGAGGIGIEKIYPLFSPTIEKIEIVKSGKMRRAKAYFMRKRFGKKAKLKEKIKIEKILKPKELEDEKTE